MKRAECPKMDTEAKRRKKTTVLLPQELIDEVLRKCPVKSLVRFKIVSKSWHSLISDSQFTTSHFDLAAVRKDRILLIGSAACEIQSLDFNASLHNDSALAALRFELPDSEHHFKQIGILGSCRGFVLLDCTSHLCAWNPSTGVHREVPYSPIETIDEEDPTFFIFLRGFGYDPATDDYFVVQVVEVFSRRNDANRVEVFSLRANAWTEIEASHLSYTTTPNPNYSADQCGLLFNGGIHWFALPYEGYDGYIVFGDLTNAVVIVVFDVTKRSFSEIPLPPVNLEYSILKHSVLRELGELLSLCVAGGSNRSIEIWVMEEYKVQSSWTRTIVVSPDDVPIRYFSPICSTKSGDIVGSDGYNGLAKCSDKGQMQERRSYFNGRLGLHAAVHTESLFLLPCDRE